MIITNVTKRKSGYISISYEERGNHITIILTPHEIIQNYNAAQQNAHQTGGEPAAKVGFLTLEEDAAIKADNTPAHPLVA